MMNHYVKMLVSIFFEYFPVIISQESVEIGQNRSNMIIIWFCFGFRVEQT